MRGKGQRGVLVVHHSLVKNTEDVQRKNKTLRTMLTKLSLG